MLNSEKIKQLAREMGFDEVGITRPASLIEGEQAIEDWVREGKHGSMKYLEDFAKRRERFFQEFGKAASIIVLGVNYFSKSVSFPAVFSLNPHPLRSPAPTGSGS